MAANGIPVNVGEVRGGNPGGAEGLECRIPDDSLAPETGTSKKSTNRANDPEARGSIN